MNDRAAETSHKETVVPDARLSAEAAGLGLSSDELARLLQALGGRRPSREELAVCGALWSEHCSYKSSRVHLKRFHTQAPWVVQGPGENAGVYAVNQNWCIAFKMESHNHPSYIEPYQGAATGVGGILRDVFCMGARPIASLNCLRFGQGHWNAHLLKRVVEGIADYGNSVGVPTVGGDTLFHPLYTRNILVNAFTAGIVHKDRIFRGVLEEPSNEATKKDGKGKDQAALPSANTAQALPRKEPEPIIGQDTSRNNTLREELFPKSGNILVYFGSATGRDGVHGATMSSSEFSDSTTALKPTVQVGDPFAEKIILEATMALIQSGAIVGLQDMGAAGLTSSSAEMAGRSGCGVAIDLSSVPLRVASGSLAAWEILLSESQERMLCAVTPSNLDKVMAILSSFDIPHSVIGKVNATGRFVCVYQNKVTTDLPVSLLTDEAPVYNWPLTDRDDYLRRHSFVAWDTAPVTTEGQASASAGLSLDIKIRGLHHEQSRLHAALVAAPGRLTLRDVLSGELSFAPIVSQTLRNPSFASRLPLVQHYCATVGGQTTLADGAHFTGAAAVVRLPPEAREPGLEAEQGVAFAGGCWERWVTVDPLQGAAHSTAAVARKLVATGALPRAMTDCLNFGSPRDPDVMRQISDAIDGINLVAKSLSIPVVSGNVSLNNQTDGRPIPPTPMIGVAGDHPDVRKNVPAELARVPRFLEHVRQLVGHGPLHLYAIAPKALGAHVSYTMSELAFLWGDGNRGPVPAFDSTLEQHLWDAVGELQTQLPAASGASLEAQGLEAARPNHLLACRPIGRGGLYFTSLRLAQASRCHFEPTDDLLELPATWALGEGQAGFLVLLSRSLTADPSQTLAASLGTRFPDLKVLELGRLRMLGATDPSDTDEHLDLGFGVTGTSPENDTTLAPFFSGTEVFSSQSEQHLDHAPGTGG